MIALVLAGAAIASFSQSLTSDELSEIPTDSSLNSLALTMMTGSKSSELFGDILLNLYFSSCVKLFL